MVARLLVALALLALTAQATTCNYECQMRRDYRWVGSAQADGDFSYSRFDSKGPASWGSIDARCNGLRQSPVDLTGAVVDKTLAPLQISYTPALNVAVTNNGLGVKLTAPTDTPNKISAGPLSGSYNWLETHFHSYSEHTINGGYFPLEAHFVHINSNVALRNTSEELSVIGVFYAEGTVPNTFLAQFADTVFSLDAAGKTATVAKVDFSTAFGSKLVYYTYLGSLTTPNCRESVTWIVLDEVQSATGEQITKISSRLPDYSYRPLQSLNGRTVRTTSALAAGSASFSTSAFGSSSTTNTATSSVSLNFAGLLAGVTP